MSVSVIVFGAHFDVPFNRFTSVNCCLHLSGWCPTVVPPPTCGDPVPLDDGHTLLLQAASQGNVTLLSMLLNQVQSTDVNHLQQDFSSALFSAAQHGHTGKKRTPKGNSLTQGIGHVLMVYSL